MKTSDDRGGGNTRKVSAGKEPSMSVENDPLAELIRIVKEEDPFADILADTRKPRAKTAVPPAQTEAVEPRTEEDGARSQSLGEPPHSSEPSVVPVATVQPLRPQRPAQAVPQPTQPVQRAPAQHSVSAGNSPRSVNAAEPSAQTEADRLGVVARIQRRSEQTPDRSSPPVDQAKAEPTVRSIANSVAAEEKARAAELEEAMRRSMTKTLDTMQRSRQTETESSGNAFTGRFRLSNKDAGTPQTFSAPVEQPPMQPAARAPRQAAPSLEPVDLESALREFRDAPGDALNVRPAQEPAPVSHLRAVPDPAPPRAPQRPVAPAPLDLDGPRDLDEPAFAAFDDGAFETYEDEFEDEFEETVVPRRRRGGLFAVGVVLGLMLLGGGFVYSFGTDFMSSAESVGEPPIIRADARPTKIVPDQPGGQDIPHQNKLVYDRVNAGDDPAPREEAIVSREEPVVDVAMAQPNGNEQVGSDPAMPPGVTLASPPTTTVRVAPTDTAASEAPQQPVTTAAVRPAGPSDNQSGEAGSLQPVAKKVKTLTIRPDGTIVQSDPVAPATETTAALQPPVAAVPDAAAAQEAVVDEPLSGGDLALLGTPSPGTPLPALRPDYAPVRVAAAQPQQVAPRPTQTDAPLSLVPQQQQQPVQTPTVARAAPAALPQVDNAGGYVVQLAARRSEEQAVGAFNELRSKYSALRGYQPNIQRADLGDRGVYYRVRVGPLSDIGSANQLCDSLKSAGMNDCLVRRQ